MALITRIEMGQKERNLVHNEVECTYVTFTIGDSAYFQLDTYGSSQRKMKGKVSQSLQLNREGAQELMRLLEKAFPQRTAEETSPDISAETSADFRPVSRA